MMIAATPLKKLLMKTVDKSGYRQGQNRFEAGPIWKRMLWHFTSALVFENSLFPINRLKVSLLRLFGASVGNNVTIKPCVTIKFPWLLSIGSYVGIGQSAWIDNLAQVSIEDQVTISQGALLLTGNHDYKSVGFDLKLGEITVEQGVWVGAKSVICPGVRLKSHCVIGVGAVVTRDTEPYTVYFGSPAVKVRDRVIE